MLIHTGHVECARCLIEAGADVQAECDGCPALILAVCTAALAGRGAAALQLVQMLLEAGADPMQRCAARLARRFARVGWREWINQSGL